MGRSKQRSLIGTIQAEQLKLVKIQELLENLLTKVNESINVLKVEELQLKSSAVATMQSNEWKLSSNIVTNLKPSAVISKSFDRDDDIETKRMREDKFEYEINKQEIELDMLKPPARCSLEEEEEEEEED